MSDPDLLAPASRDRLVSGAYLQAVLSHARRTIALTAVAGAVLGLLFTFAPASESASTTVVLRYPAGSDPTHAIATDLSLLTTRPVAQGAVKELRTGAAPESLLSHYHGAILSDGVMIIIASGHDVATARSRADAVARSFLAFRAQLSRDQVAAASDALREQQRSLRTRVAALTAQIQSVDANAADGAARFQDLVSARAALNAQVDQIDSTISTNEVSAKAATDTSHVIDPASSPSKSIKKTAAKNMLTGFLVGLVLGVGGVLFLALARFRVRRRADVAAAMRAPVRVSVGPVVPPAWRRVFRIGVPTPVAPNADLQLIVTHLETTLAITSANALVVVAIDSLQVATLAVRSLAHRLRSEGLGVAIVNETGKAWPIESTLEDEGRDDTARDADVVLVLAVLDPAKGAEHLREWAANAVALVTTGRSTETKLRANATMIRRAALDLRSIALIDADKSDDTLGIFDASDSSEVLGETVQRSEAVGI
jgi:hypothetical protein